MFPMKNVISALMIIITCLFIAGCQYFDFDGNGRFDPVEYLSNSDIQVTWVDEDGNAYVVNPLQLGTEILYTYVEVKTGYRFELAPQQDGSIGIMVRDPNGQEIWIMPAPEPPPPDAPPALKG